MQTPSTIQPSIQPISFSPDPAPTQIYTLSLHDALPILRDHVEEEHRGHLPGRHRLQGSAAISFLSADQALLRPHERSEEHTSELQSRLHLVCRLLLEKKNRRRGRRG